MSEIRIERTVSSDTLHLSEPAALIGKRVTILITDAESAIVPGTGDRDAAEQAADRLKRGGYDFDAWMEQRDLDRQQSQIKP